MRIVLDSFSSSKTGVAGVANTVIVFTKDGKVKQLKNNFQQADIDLITVIIGDGDENSKDKDNDDEDINSVIVDDAKKLPNVYGTLESVIRERLGIVYI